MKQLDTKDIDIIVLGCGNSGMITSITLASYGFKVTIIERSKVEYDSKLHDNSRTTALTPISREFFEKLNIWTKLEPFSNPIDDIYVIDNKHPSMLQFSKNSLNNILGYIIKNADFKKILYDIVKAIPLIEIIDNCTYSQIISEEDSTILELTNGLSFRAKLVIACDGRKTLLYQQHFKSQIIKDYNQTALTFFAKHEKPHENTAVEHFMPSGPFAILPTIDPYISSIVWSVKTNCAHIYNKLPKEEFEYWLQENFGPFLGRIQLSSKIDLFPLKAYLSQNYYYNKIALVADTAHVIHPLAGQGLNQGIKDIALLTNMIAKYGVQGVDLQSYEKKRKNDNLAMYYITDNLNKLFSNNISILHVLRTTGLGIVEKTPLLKNFLVKYASGIRNL